MVNWIKLHLLVFCSMLVLLLLSSLVFAGQFLWFDLCIHETGEKKGPVHLKGFNTKGGAWIQSGNIDAIIPLKHDLCVILGLGSGDFLSVMGSHKEVYCRVHGKSACKMHDKLKTIK